MYKAPKLTKYYRRLETRFIGFDPMYDKNTLDYMFDVKYLCRPNRGFYITNSITRPTDVTLKRRLKKRDTTLHPGKGQFFVKARRRSFMALASCWEFFFSKLILRQELLELGDSDLNLEFVFSQRFRAEYYMFFTLTSANSMLIKYFYLLIGHIQK